MNTSSPSKASSAVLPASVYPPGIWKGFIIFPHEKFAEVTKNTNCKWFITYDDSIKVRKMFRGKAVYGGR